MITEDNCPAANEKRNLLITEDMRRNMDILNKTASGLSYEKLRLLWIHALNTRCRDISTSVIIEILITWCLYKEHVATAKVSSSSFPTRKLFKDIKYYVLRNYSLEDHFAMSCVLADLQALTEMTDECLPFLFKFEEHLLRVVYCISKLRSSQGTVSEHLSRFYNSVKHSGIWKPQENDFKAGLDALADAVKRKDRESFLLFVTLVVGEFVVNAKGFATYFDEILQLTKNHLPDSGLEIASRVSRDFMLLCNETNSSEEEESLLFIIFLSIQFLILQNSKPAELDVVAGITEQKKIVDESIKQLRRFTPLPSE